MVWVRKSVTCEKTNPDLYSFSSNFVLFLVISIVVKYVVSCLILAVFVYGVRRGWFETSRGASPDTIKKIETVPYDESTFSEEESLECCCCMVEFDAEKEIKRTPCKHFFHADCLGNWLKQAKTCPLCREDLEASVKGPVGPQVSDPAEAV
jgi:hypothetical protein